MADNFPLSVRAAAELELRRRQRERAAMCFMCEVSAMIDEVYGSVIDPDAVCGHASQLQDIDSAFNQRLIADFEMIYGG